MANTGYEVEPEAVAVNGNGIHGHHDAGGIGPMVELVSANSSHANRNGHAAVPINNNGHHDEAEEPVKPRGRSRKPQPATLSMFEWAMTLEQER